MTALLQSNSRSLAAKSSKSGGASGAGSHRVPPAKDDLAPQFSHKGYTLNDPQGLVFKNLAAQFRAK
ncbi:MAG TPA: hypothetical protein VM915_15235, partial [Verrucomicrobiae bacterium]|nr:hypothetical protein [Verrucomicrobiae bacterium]